MLNLLEQWVEQFSHGLWRVCEIGILLLMAVGVVHLVLWLGLWV